jgi:release factor glutamine methyltransferase
VPRRVDDLLHEARARLGAAPFSPSPREALLLLGRVLGWSEAQVLSRGEREVPAESAARFVDLLERRLSGEPVAYLLGEREFYGRTFAVDRRVLIPRPETEHLVEAVLALPLPASPRLLDVGTGSGALAVTLALELPGAFVAATDLSPAALAVARGNALRLGARVGFVATDLAAAVNLSPFDLIVSNPPYLGDHEATAISLEIKDFEPHMALFAEAGGRRVLDRLLDLERSLRPGGWLVVEVGAEQAAGLAADASRRGWEVHRQIEDYAGIPRVVVLRSRGHGTQER